MEFGSHHAGPGDELAVGPQQEGRAEQSQEDGHSEQALHACWVPAVHTVFKIAGTQLAQARPEGCRGRACGWTRTHELLLRDVRVATQEWTVLRTRAPQHGHFVELACGARDAAEGGRRLG